MMISLQANGRYLHKMKKQAGYFKLLEAIKMEGQVRVIARDPLTRRIMAIRTAPNMVVTSGKQLVGDLLIARTGYTVGVTYCVLGAGDTAPSLSDTQLTDEGGGAAMRKVITSRSRTGEIVTFSTFFLASECTLDMKEVGLFGYPADGTENSGTLLNHALVSYDNSSGTYDLTIDVTMEVKA